MALNGSLVPPKKIIERFLCLFFSPPGVSVCVCVTVERTSNGAKRLETKQTFTLMSVWCLYVTWTQNSTQYQKVDQTIASVVYAVSVSYTNVKKNCIDTLVVFANYTNVKKYTTLVRRTAIVGLSALYTNAWRFKQPASLMQNISRISKRSTPGTFILISSKFWIISHRFMWI